MLSTIADLLLTVLLVVVGVTVIGYLAFLVWDTVATIFGEA